MSSPPKPPITIIGAGLSGLTLALCLKRHGISATIYDRASSPPHHRYGITLYRRTYLPLLNLLHIDESTFRKTLAVDGLWGGLGRLGMVSQDGFRCHRGRFEALIGEGLSIRWGKRLRDVQGGEGSGEGVTAVFEDGIVQRTGLLVGCDGPHSMVRQSLNSRMKLRVLPYVVFSGKREISDVEFMRDLHPYMQDEVLISTRKGDVRLEVSINEVSGDRVGLSYVYSRPARTDGDPLCAPDRTVASARDIPEEFYAELAELDLEQPYRAILNADKVRGDRVLHWLMRSGTPDLDEMKQLASQNVVLLGDAVHATPILGGNGANAAIVDGIEMADHIAANDIGELQTFLEAKQEGWTRLVEDSSRRLNEMHMTKSSNLS